MDHTEDLVAFGNHQRRAAGIGDAVGDALDFGADSAAQFLDEADDRFDRAFADDGVRRDRNRSCGFRR